MRRLGSRFEFELQDSWNFLFCSFCSLCSYQEFGTFAVGVRCDRPHRKRGRAGQSAIVSSSIDGITNFCANSLKLASTEEMKPLAMFKSNKIGSIEVGRSGGHSGLVSLSLSVQTWWTYKSIPIMVSIMVYGIESEYQPGTFEVHTSRLQLLEQPPHGFVYWAAIQVVLSPLTRPPYEPPGIRR